MTATTLREVGAYYTAEGSTLVLPKEWRGDGTVMGLVYVHGATQTDAQVLDSTTYPAIVDIMRSVAAAGWPVLSIYAGGDLWGNATAMARMGSAKTYLQSTIGAKSGKIGLIGGSMGGLTVQNYAQANPSSVAVAVGLVPVSDVSDFVTNNRGGLASSINTAYSTWNEGTMGTTYNPHTYASGGNLAACHYKCWYGASDTIVIPSTVTDVATAAGTTAVSCVGDHNTSLNSVTIADVVTHIRTYAT